MTTALQLTGQKFGRLLVLRRAENQITPDGRSRSRWLCAATALRTMVDCYDRCCERLREARGKAR